MDGRKWTINSDGTCKIWEFKPVRSCEITPEGRVILEFTDERDHPGD